MSTTSPSSPPLAASAPTSPSPPNSTVSPSWSALTQSLSAYTSHLPPAIATLPYIPAYVFSRDSKTRASAEALLPAETLWAIQLGLAGSLGGFLSGFYLGGRTRSYQFLAENAHRLPKTVAGWYYYHKYKNYEIAYFGFRGGFKGAARFAGISAGFGAAEGVVEHLVGKESWVCTVGAGVSMATVFSLANRLTLQYSKYAVLFGAGASFMVGMLQDGYAWQYGESVKYSGRSRSEAFWVPGWGAFPVKDRTHVSPASV
ncbi:hypothetical protein HKX48_008905 [Thoreauomyces humboldtii]|nr:hypothetical protein HKX48_008905 [Thoreauomyces humboldtii]